jgi:hypothetical protein
MVSPSNRVAVELWRAIEPYSAATACETVHSARFFDCTGDAIVTAAAGKQPRRAAI